ncbi:uncharacterized protein [Solanum tuberosum]|uniref:uncharacterized protein isoform X3 n=1 Tax=Solanum tuberosum TaxID=4113 RepID=UPI000739F925|nr:PREDICTED: uncharacterized protein LOC102587277 isoform X3 [Solanum tuberosum]
MYLFVFSILIPYCDEFEHEGKEVKRSGEAYQFQDSKPHTQFVETRLGKYQLLLCDPKMFWHELTVRDVHITSFNSDLDPKLGKVFKWNHNRGTCAYS